MSATDLLDDLLALETSSALGVASGHLISSAEFGGQTGRIYRASAEIEPSDNRRLRTLLDRALTAAAHRELQGNRLIPRGAICVAVEDGWLTLTGGVDHLYQYLAVLHVARRLIGVRGSYLRIRLTRGRGVVGSGDGTGSPRRNPSSADSAA